MDLLVLFWLNGLISFFSLSKRKVCHWKYDSVFRDRSPTLFDPSQILYNPRVGTFFL